MNSGIESVKRIDEWFYVTGVSGSVYKCLARGEGLANSFDYIYQQLSDDSQAHNAVQLIKMNDYLEING